MLKQKSSEYRGFRNAGIRLKEDMLPQLGQIYGARIPTLMPAVHAFDKAHIVMLVEQRLLTPQVGAALLKGLRALEAQGVVETRMRVGGGLHSGEQFLIRLLGEDIGGRMHVARSSGDLSSVGMNITQRAKLLELMRAVNKLRRVLIAASRSHTETILPGYSFGQQAQPMTLAHLWLSWAATLARDFERLHGAYGRINRSAAGAAIMVGSEFPIDRKRTAELLGFDAVHENCADAILELTNDDSLEVPAVVSVLYHSLAKWADDLIQFSTEEYRFLDIPDRYCNTSSIMMQKKNVIGPAEVKGASAEALAAYVVAYHGLKGPTGMPVTERYHACEMLWKVADSAVRDLGWFCDLLPVLIVNKPRMRAQSWENWATVTDLAGALVTKNGLPWRTAHQIIGIMVRLCVERGLGPADVTPALVDEASRLYHELPLAIDQATIDDALSPERFIAKRALQGGPARDESLRQANVFEAALKSDEQSVAGIDARLADAARKLEAAIDGIIAAPPQ